MRYAAARHRDVRGIEVKQIGKADPQPARLGIEEFPAPGHRPFARLRQRAVPVTSASAESLRSVDPSDCRVRAVARLPSACVPEATALETTDCAAKTPFSLVGDRRRGRSPRPDRVCHARSPIGNHATTDPRRYGDEHHRPAPRPAPYRHSPSAAAFASFSLHRQLETVGEDVSQRNLVPSGQGRRRNNNAGFGVEGQGAPTPYTDRKRSGVCASNRRRQQFDLFDQQQPALRPHASEQPRTIEGFPRRSPVRREAPFHRDQMQRTATLSRNAALQSM